MRQGTVEWVRRGGEGRGGKRIKKGEGRGERKGSHISLCRKCILRGYNFITPYNNLIIS